jgi:lipopolysaccharide/colanic/teichoic acid biosynthesis glycosyltransferase
MTVPREPRTKEAPFGRESAAVDLKQMAAQQANGAGVLVVPDRNHLATATKGALDIVVSLVAIVVLIPLFLAIAVIIRLDSPGPVFFRSPRVGRNGETFGMLKFRTMIVGADEQRDALRHMSEAPDGLFKLRSDPRFTRFGRKLRATSLDELPQLFHVLTGKMSLVGPRPLPPEEDALVQAAGLRMQARPGMTGPWQVAGSWRVPLVEMVELDNDYLTNWSLWTDVKLLARTVPHVLRRRGV